MMNELETHSRSPVGRLRREPAPKTPVDTQLGKCLVVSPSDSKRSMISLAAGDAGWDTIVCADAHDGMAAIQRIRFQMAWVDLEHSSEASLLRRLCEAIAAFPKMLLVVCGQVDIPEEEIWARQLGVWLYLPGISLNHSGEIAAMCEQAQLVTGGTQTAG